MPVERLQRKLWPTTAFRVVLCLSVRQVLSHVIWTIPFSEIWSKEFINVHVFLISAVISFITILTLSKKKNQTYLTSSWVFWGVFCWVFFFFFVEWTLVRLKFPAWPFPQLAAINAAPGFWFSHSSDTSISGAVMVSHRSWDSWYKFPAHFNGKMPTPQARSFPLAEIWCSLSAESTVRFFVILIWQINHHP